MNDHFYIRHRIENLSDEHLKSDAPISRLAAAHCARGAAAARLLPLDAGAFCP